MTECLLEGSSDVATGYSPSRMKCSFGQKTPKYRIGIAASFYAQQREHGQNTDNRHSSKKKGLSVESKKPLQLNILNWLRGSDLN